MIPSERRDYIYRYVHEYQLASISALSELMSVSHMTVRRDIRVLEEQGKVVSVSGGVRLSEALRRELAYCEKAQLHHRHKREIGKYAAGLVEDGRGLSGRRHHHLRDRPQHGGALQSDGSHQRFFHHSAPDESPAAKPVPHRWRVDQRNYSCVGNSAAMLLRSLNIDVAFISTSSWDLEHGLSTPHEEKVLVKQALLEVARRRVLVSDSSKYGKYGMFRVCPLEALSDIICDAALPPEAQQLLRERGLQLHNVQL